MGVQKNESDALKRYKKISFKFGNDYTEIK